MNWTTYLMGFADHAALKSKDSTKVGAALVGPDNAVLLCAFNGPPRGVHDHIDRFERPKKYLYASHAEQNIVAFAARKGIATAGCMLYVTHHPCASCARSIIQAGIALVIWRENGFSAQSPYAAELSAAAEMFAEAKVGCFHVDRWR